MAKKTKLPNLIIKPIEEDIVEEESEKEPENPFVEEKESEKKDDVVEVEEQKKEIIKENKSSDLSDIQLKMMTNKKLKELCKAKGLRGYSSMKKSQLLKILGVVDEKKDEKKTEDSEELKTHIPESPGIIEPEDVMVRAQPDPQLDEKLELEPEEEVQTDIGESEEETMVTAKTKRRAEIGKKVVQKIEETKKTKAPRKKKMTQKQIEEKTENIRENVKTRKQLRQEQREKQYNPFKSHYNII